MAEAASAVAISDAQFFASDIQAPPTNPKSIADAFQHTLLSFHFSSRRKPIHSVSDKLNAMIEWACTTRETLAPPLYENPIHPKDLPQIRQEQALTRSFILQTLNPLDALANTLMVNSIRAEQLHTKLPLEERMYLAEMIQRFSRGLYAASHPGSPSELHQNAKLFIDFINRMEYINEGIGGLGRRYLTGALAQSQAMHIFDDNNHLVYLPDVNNGEELLTWEHHAADFVVWRKGQPDVIKLDIKGDNTLELPEIIVKEAMQTDAMADKKILESILPLIERDLATETEKFKRPAQIISVQLTVPVNLTFRPLEKLNKHFAEDTLHRIDRL